MLTQLSVSWHIPYVSFSSSAADTFMPPLDGLTSELVALQLESCARAQSWLP